MSTELAIAQFIAYVTLTVTSITVATVSLMFSYRQNFGWKPIFFPVSHGMKGKGGEKSYFLVVEFEMWNRRTYPIVIRRVDMEFTKVKFLYDPPWGEKSKDWHINNDRAHFRNEITVSPKDHQRIKFEGPFQTESLDKLRSDIKVTAHIFDPRRNTTDKLSFDYVYSMK